LIVGLGKSRAMNSPIHMKPIFIFAIVFNSKVDLAFFTTWDIDLYGHYLSRLKTALPIAFKFAVVGWTFQQNSSRKTMSDIKVVFGVFVVCVSTFSPANGLSHTEKTDYINRCDNRRDGTNNGKSSCYPVVNNKIEYDIEIHSIPIQIMV